MSRATVRLAGTAVVVALLAGLHGFQVNVFEVIVGLGIGRNVLAWPLYDGFAAVAFLLVPLVAGYVWGRAADVTGNYVALLGVTAVAAVVGFLAGYVFSILPVLLVGGDLVPGGALRWLLLFLTLGLETLALPVVALAGGAIAQFGSPGAGIPAATAAEGSGVPAAGSDSGADEDWDRMSDG